MPALKAGNLFLVRDEEACPDNRPVSIRSIRQFLYSKFLTRFYRFVAESPAIELLLDSSLTLYAMEETYIEYMEMLEDLIRIQSERITALEEELALMEKAWIISEQ